MLSFALRHKNVKRDLITCSTAGDLTIDTLKKESESLMIPANKLPDYVRARILTFKDHELAQKQLELQLEKKQFDFDLAKKETEKQALIAQKETEKQLELQKKQFELDLSKKEFELNLSKKEFELNLSKKEAEKQSALQLDLSQKEFELNLSKKEAEKQLALQLERKQLDLELERFRMNITKTGLLWKLKTQTQRHALELFLFDCWERMQQFSEDEIRQIRMKNKRFPLVPANANVRAASCILWHVLSLCFQRS